jgi:hypothetical protein
MSIIKKDITTRTQLTFFSKGHGLGDTIEYPGILNLQEGKRFEIYENGANVVYVVKRADPDFLLTHESTNHDVLTAHYLLNNEED